MKIQTVTRKVALEDEDAEQIPVTISTFTNERKLYLSPGVNMRTTHPESLRNPVLPNPRKTVIEYKGEWLNVRNFANIYFKNKKLLYVCFFAVL